MKVHWLQHVGFEGLGFISQWIGDRKHEASFTRFFLNEHLPQLDDFDMLIVMGGPMGIHDHRQYPWLVEEKKFISSCVAQNKPVLGVCLGAQLLAAALQAEVTSNNEKEIGWFEILRSKEIPAPLTRFLPDRLNVLHWHGDTFSLPASAHHLFSSEGCRNQAFIHGNRQIGLQFHIEIGKAELQPLIENCQNELKEEGPWIEDEAALLADKDDEQQRKKMLFDILDYISS